MEPYILDSNLIHNIRLDRVQSEYGYQEKILIPKENPNPCFCIFCLRSTPYEVTFKKDAHTLPAGLGNNTYFNNKTECDTCNGIISTYESSLANYLIFDKIFGRGSSRSAFKELVKKNTDGSYFKSKPDSDKVEIGLIENGDIKVDLTTKQINIKINTSINYEFLSKAIMHSVWSILKAEVRAKYNHIREWLLQPQKQLSTLYIESAFLPGKSIDNVVIEVWRGNEDYPDNSVKNYPLVIRYYYGYHMLQFYIPVDESVKEVPTVNSAIFNYGMLKDPLSITSIIGSQGRKLEPIRFGFEFDSFKRNDDGTFTLFNFLLVSSEQDLILLPDESF
ncbi:hypothetical protein ACDX66_11300 [Peribacillus frigoritolerans]